MSEKLTLFQIEVLAKMRNGWELAHSGGMSPRIWLQENGAGRGGATMTVNSRAFQRLLDLRYIRLGRVRASLTEVYELTEKAGGTPPPTSAVTTADPATGKTKEA